MAGNITTTCQNMHVDIRYRYVNKYVENKLVRLVFVKSADNNSNILPNCLSEELHQKHSRKMVGEELWDVASFKIFEIKRKSVRDDVIISNTLFDDMWMTWVSLTWLQVSYIKCSWSQLWVNWQLEKLLSICLLWRWCHELTAEPVKYQLNHGC